MRRFIPIKSLDLSHFWRKDCHKYLQKRFSDITICTKPFHHRFSAWLSAQSISVAHLSFEALIPIGSVMGTERAYRA